MGFRDPKKVASRPENVALRLGMILNHLLGARKIFFTFLNAHFSTRKDRFGTQNAKLEFKRIASGVETVVSGEKLPFPDSKHCEGPEKQCKIEHDGKCVWKAKMWVGLFSEATKIKFKFTFEPDHSNWILMARPFEGLAVQIEFQLMFRFSAICSSVRPSVHPFVHSFVRPCVRSPKLFDPVLQDWEFYRALFQNFVIDLNLKMNINLKLKLILLFCLSLNLCLTSKSMGGKDP